MDLKRLQRERNRGGFKFGSSAEGSGVTVQDISLKSIQSMLVVQ